MKNISFLSEIFQFLEVKFSLYLNRQVFVMFNIIIIIIVVVVVAAAAAAVVVVVVLLYLLLLLLSSLFLWILSNFWIVFLYNKV